VALEYRFLELAQDRAAARAFQRWIKEGKKLRQALEPIRDADVYLKRLNGLRDTLGRVPDGEPKLRPRCLREIDKVEGFLKQQRQEGADELVEVIDTRRRRLNRLTKEMEVALAPGMTAKVHSTAQVALKVFAGLASEFPQLDSTNLHAYRKRLKQALYLVEFSATSEPLAGRLAAAFRKIHGAIGEWHDWQSLAEEADRILPKQTRRDGLVSVLETLAEEALQKALTLCRRSAAQILKSPAPVGPFPPRKPVASDPGRHAGDEHRLFGISS
jgi:CHAD domain-containing protein